MRKIFTLALALMGFVGGANAATIDEVAVCKHSYVFVADDYTINGTGSRTKGGIFGDGYFLDVTGGSVNAGKGKVNLAEADGVIVTEEIAAKYGEYGTHLNSLRLKNDQDVIAMKVTANSKLIIFYQNNGAERYPLFGSDIKPSTSKLEVQGTISETVNKIARMEWTAPDDMTIYIGSQGGDMFISYIIVEANEAEGTPNVKVGDQTFENGLWYREVTCKPAQAYAMGTIVTYTTDGTAPTAASTVYTEPIKCYKEMTLKFQAFMDLGTGTADQSGFLEGADNEANVNFKFDAPTISAEGATVTVTSPYEGAENYILVNGDNEEKANSITLEESATITAYSKIINGDYAEFISNSASQDVYVLNPIKEKKTIAVIAGDVVLDEVATETSTTGPVYMVENGAISADKMDFFVKNLTFKALTDEQYQVPAGNERYIQMSNTNISFLVAEGDSVDVKVICSKNSCKNLDADDAAEDKLEDGCTPDRMCYVNVSGKTYCHMEEVEEMLKDQQGNDSVLVKKMVKAGDLKLYPETANVIEFGLTAGTYTFQKYSGTGNILISSIEITPVAQDPEGITAVNAAVKANAPIYNLAGQKVNANFRGLQIVAGKKIMK